MEQKTAMVCPPSPPSLCYNQDKGIICVQNGIPWCIVHRYILLIIREAILCGGSDHITGEEIAKVNFLSKFSNVEILFEFEYILRKMC